MGGFSDMGSHFYDGPFDYEEEATMAEYKEQHKGFLENVQAGKTPGVEPIIVKTPTSKTAYYTMHAKWSASVTPGTTVSDGYDMACLLEETMKNNLEEWLGTDMQLEVFVQVNVR